jgi:molybdenum cofactor biosynthesis protein B
MSHTEHRGPTPGLPPAAVRCAVLTISDTRTEATDTGGAAIVSLLEAAGHVVAEKTIVRDEPADVRAWIERHVTAGDARILITTGGTGITGRDGTFEVASAIIEKPLPGFGELFRMLSYQEIGAAAMLSRACAGRVGRAILVCLPGSEHAVRLAMEKLLLPELGHLVREATR